MLTRTTALDGTPKAMRFLSMYSGLGAHDLGLERAGHRCVGQIEIDPFCSAVLEKHWPGLPRWKDVRHVTVDAVRAACGAIDLLTGGFACQDVSAAGKGAGLGRRTRSGLTWRHMFRIIRDLRPAWLVIENVPVLRGRGADRVIGVLERIGYACWPVVVGAEHVGAPHRRHRVWIVGHLANTARSAWNKRAERLRVGESGQSELADAGGARLEVGSQPKNERGNIRHERQAAPSRRYGVDWPGRPNEQQHEWEAPRLIEFEVGGAASRSASRLVRASNRNALRALGNANPPQVIELIGRWLAIQGRGVAC